MKGKIVENDTAGQQVRPFDISITKNVLALFFSCGILIFLVLRLSGRYRKLELEGNPDAFPPESWDHGMVYHEYSRRVIKNVWGRIIRDMPLICSRLFSLYS